MAERESNYERRQGMRARGGWVWGNWLPCSEAEARRVTGLQSWQVRQYGLCACCAGTGRGPLGAQGDDLLDQCDACVKPEACKCACFRGFPKRATSGVNVPAGGQQHE